jgi:hypothetical protein
MRAFPTSAVFSPPSNAEAAITALLYAPGAATETNAVALCEKGIFGLQNQVELKLKAEQAAAAEAIEVIRRNVKL